MRSWVVDSRGLAMKVKGATASPELQIKDCGASRECPNCHYLIDNSDVLHEWPGLPMGVKFDPDDVQLLEHLAAKCGVGNATSHEFIDNFIPTLEEEEGICYTHPENLPGAKKDGNSIHFFHRTINAYATGSRKRRKIHSQASPLENHVRWHKTGKTKPVTENGVQRGCKKIMVLYRSSKKGTKPDKANWAMHQYHLGTDEDEKEGEFVVSKIFYQGQKMNDKSDVDLVIEEPNVRKPYTSPRTPNTNTPNPPRLGRSGSHDDVDDNVPQESAQEAEITEESAHGHSSTILKCLAGESQAVKSLDQDDIDGSLLCKEIFDSCAPLNVSGLRSFPFHGFNRNGNNFLGDDNSAAYCSIAELETLKMDTPPDFQLTELQFCSDDSIFGRLDLL